MGLVSLVLGYLVRIAVLSFESGRLLLRERGLGGERMTLHLRHQVLGNVAVRLRGLLPQALRPRDIAVDEAAYCLAELRQGMDPCAQCRHRASEFTGRVVDDRPEEACMHVILVLLHRRVLRGVNHVTDSGQGAQH